MKETKQFGLKRSRVDASVFWREGASVFMLVHVDDILVSGEFKEVEKLFQDLQNDMKLRE